MDFGPLLVTFSSQIFTVLSWPSFTLVCPLYASIRAIESDSNSKTQQCLAYWVLFSLTTYLELALASLFSGLPFWPHAKGLFTLLLVIPYFGGASYVYEHFVRPYTKNRLLFPRNLGFMLSEQDSVLHAAEGKKISNEPKEYLEKVVICEENSEPRYDTKGMGSTWPINGKKVQQEWSCPICLVNTTSSKCLRKHLKGKKHKTKEEELRSDELATKNRHIFPILQKGSRMVLLDNFNKLAWGNLEKWSGFLSPVTKSVRLCKWRRPKHGWTKLNTDGSIDKENAGFGGLLRDHDGNPVCAFVSKSTQGDIFLVELWAVWRGLVLAMGLGIKVIWIESDSLSVVKTIKKQQPYGPKASSCLWHIWELLKKFEKYQVSHSWRETNKAADFLSKMVLKGNDVVMWPVDFPENLRNIIKDDAQGKIYYRS